MSVFVSCSSFLGVLLTPNRYKGCYEDKIEDGRRALEIQVYKVDGNGVNSNGKCLVECSGRGYTFAGTQVTKLRESILSKDPTPRVPDAVSTMADFTLVDENHVSVLLAASPVKTCDLDPMPTELI
ncbi:hypothetical protein CAPTEDRAFT_185699, partial [Capitella teleta]